MRARRRFAQHFLEAAWVRKLVEQLDARPDDGVLEIGPGRGALTRALAPKVRHVVAIEIDRELSADLRRGAPTNVTIVEADVLRVDLGQVLRDLADACKPTGRVRVVGNLPYNISSPILFQLVDAVRRGAPLSDATVMLQKEVADRVAARPGSRDWGPLGIALQLRADIERVLSLPPGAFRPVPRVQSAVVRLVFGAPRVDLVDEALFGSLVRAIFSQRRKTLLNAARAFASARNLEPAALLGAAGIDGRRRPETLDLTELARLAAAVAADRPGPRPAML